MTNYTIETCPEGDRVKFLAHLVNGPMIAGGGDTEGEAIDRLVGYLRDLVNARNEEKRAREALEELTR